MLCFAGVCSSASPCWFPRSTPSPPAGALVGLLHGDRLSFVVVPVAASHSSCFCHLLSACAIVGLRACDLHLAPFVFAGPLLPRRALLLSVSDGQSPLERFPSPPSGRPFRSPPLASLLHCRVVVSFHAHRLGELALHLLRCGRFFSSHLFLRSSFSGISVRFPLPCPFPPPHLPRFAIRCFLRPFLPPGFTLFPCPLPCWSSLHLRLPWPPALSLNALHSS